MSKAKSKKAVVETANPILELFSESSNIAAPLPVHCCSSMELNEKLLYLQALSLVMKVDGEVAPQEEKWLKTLMLTFGLPLSQFDALRKFAEQPDKDIPHEFISVFANRPEAEIFLMDAFEMIHADEVIYPEEEALIASIAKTWRLSQRLVELEEMYIAVRTRDNTSLRSIKFSPEDVNNFVHIFELHEIEFKK